MKRWGLGKRNRSLGNVYTLKNLTWHEHESMKFLVQGFILNSCQITVQGRLSTTTYNGLYMFPPLLVPAHLVAVQMAQVS